MTATISRRSLQRALVGLVVIVILGYSILLIQQLIFGLTAGSGVTASYATWERDDTATAVITTLCWSVLALAAWTTYLEIMILSAVIVSLFYAGWKCS